MGHAAGLRLRPFVEDDAAQARAAAAELALDGFVLIPGVAASTPWTDVVALLEANSHGQDVAEGWVPTTVLAPVVDDVLVGRTSIRHHLNDFLREKGGHIGFGVRPAFRRRGMATEILRQSLVVARAVGIDAVLVTCDDGNVASARTIEGCGGVLDDVIPVDGAAATRRYWIA